MERTYTFSLSREPAISGYGGYDEWTIGPLTSEQADDLLEAITNVIEYHAKRAGVEGGWTGSN